MSPQFTATHIVWVRNNHPEHCTRMEVVADRGGSKFPDPIGSLQPDRPHHLYHGRFSAHELWGVTGAPNHFVHIDLYDEHLERTAY